MKLFLKAKRLDICTGDRYVAVLHKDTAALFNLAPADRLCLKKGKNEAVAMVEISDDLIKKDTIGLYGEVYATLKVGRGDKLQVSLAEKPKSIEYIRNKLAGKRLSKQEIDAIVSDIVNEDLSDTELAYFVAGAQVQGLNDAETLELTRSIFEHGKKLTINERIIMDKHCIGGVPGNRTTLIVVPIITAAGFKMPKTTSRAISGPAGTADTFEALCNVNHSVKELEKIVKEVGGFISWGGTMDLASADDELIGVRHSLELDPPGLLLASIMAKKAAVSANTIIIDIPFGQGCKCRSKAEAKRLGHKFMKIARAFKMKLQVYLSDGTQPVGRGVGPVLEILDVIKVLRNEGDAPEDLREKSLRLAGTLIDMSGRFWWKKGYNVAKKIVESGRAYDQFQKIINAQGARKKALRPGRFTFDIPAKKSGRVKRIDNKEVIAVARLAGSPNDVAAGIFFHHKVGDRVNKRQKLFTVYSSDKQRLEFAREYLESHQPVFVD